MESHKKYMSPSFLCCFVVLCIHLQSSLAGDCPADGRTWVPFGQRCYHFVHGEEDKIKSYTIERAQSLCPHSELVTIQSAEENDFIIKYSPHVWKGQINVWLGMFYDADSEDMKWLGKETVSYTNWEYSPTPSDLVAMDTCVALHSYSGRWENISCQDEVENGVICETTQITPGEGKQKASPLLSALVILAVVTIMGISAVIWFLHQKHNLGSTIFTAFEYHPPFRAPAADESCLVMAEETDSMP